jgi:hypothetical protein
MYVYRNTGIGISIVLLVAGAILLWAVTWDPDGVNITTVGVILFIVGLIGLLVSVLLGLVPSGERESRTIHREPPDRVVERRSRDRF